MKYYIPILIVCVAILASCGSANKDEILLSEKGVVTKQLDERLARFPGVTVTGSGANAVVSIQGGVSSFDGVMTPLYILNGQPIPGGYASVYAMVDPNSIRRIEVLKGPDASQYGARGGNGVIIIKTK